VSRPSWCPNPSCVHLLGGATHEDSGSLCGGRLPNPLDHRGTPNTHRLCIKGCDDPPVDLLVNQSDLWYISRFIEGLRAKILAEEAS
jgi:hypothetical protein